MLGQEEQIKQRKVISEIPWDGMDKLGVGSS